MGKRIKVRAWSWGIDPGTTVALESGRVALSPAPKQEQAVVLEPGQTYRIAENAHEPPLPDSVAVERATAWRQGDLIFKDQWLGIILEDVERRFAVDLILTPSTLRQKPMTVSLRNPTNAAAVIRGICVVLGIKYWETSNVYEIYAPAP